MQPVSLSIEAARGAMDGGELSARELQAACLDRARALNAAMSAFITLAGQPSSDDAESTTAPGSLHGIPIAVKDLIDVAGLPTTAGSRFFGETGAAQDAFCISLLRQAGAWFVGKTNLHEIALGVTNNNPHFGTCRNPWDRARIPGGSSGGSAVAVATGMALAALGTDTGGSIRIPASLCGIVGLKPTRGRVSVRGVIPLSWNLDHVGPMARSVRDAALLLQVIAGYDEQDPSSASIPVGDYLADLEGGIYGWKVALAGGDYVAAADRDVLQAVHAAADVLRGLGAHVSEVEVPWLLEAAQANLTMTQADAAAFHAERLRSRPDWFGDDVRARLEVGAACSAMDYARTRSTQTVLRRRAEQFFGDFDALLLPSTPVAAPPIEGRDAVEQARVLTRFTAPFNLTGLPALSVPCGYTQGGLPIGLQVVAAAWREAAALRLGHAYEQAAGWHMRPPPLT